MLDVYVLFLRVQLQNAQLSLWFIECAAMLFVIVYA
jgi:hypothetical protein